MNRYLKREVHNLARFISVMKFHASSWRSAHPYIVADRVEDVTPPERVQQNRKCDRNVTLFGYLRGCNLKKGAKVFVHQFIAFLLPLNLVFGFLLGLSSVFVFRRSINASLVFHCFPVVVFGFVFGSCVTIADDALVHRFILLELETIV